MEYLRKVHDEQRQENKHREVRVNALERELKEMSVTSARLIKEREALAKQLSVAHAQIQRHQAITEGVLSLRDSFVATQ